jgi:hypothetical protein
MSDSDFISPAQHEQDEVLFDSGGTCDCYRLVKNNRVYCVKRPKPQYRQAEDYISIFRKEFEMGSTLDHPNIVRYVAYDEDEQGAYICMNFVEGNNLEEFTAQNPDWFKDKSHREQFRDELFSAMEYIHSKGMFHLDLKPRNILITDKGHHVKLIDLGFSWSESYLHDLGFTRDYCAPEQQAAKTELFSPATDIYALGKIMQQYGLASDAVIQRCLRPDPKARFQSIGELRKAIWRSKTTKIILGIGMGLTATLLMGAMIWLLANREKPQPIVPLPDVPEGAISGLFTINYAGDQVFFSQGNLQYQASTNTWRFAKHQRDYIGRDNHKASPTFEGWIDLFSWGTSGHDHGAVCFQPWSTGGQFDHAVYGHDDYNLYDSTGRADWGYNAISNGGNQEGLWRTMKLSEWRYVLKNRETASGILFAKAVVNGVNGVVFLPDDWDSTYYHLNHANNGDVFYDANVISSDDWTNALEANGSIFLPAAGNIQSWYEDAFNERGAYWSASASEGYDTPWLKSLFDFNVDYVASGGSYYPHERYSVRLIREVESHQQR